MKRIYKNIVEHEIFKFVKYVFIFVAGIVTSFYLINAYNTIQLQTNQKKLKAEKIFVTDDGTLNGNKLFEISQDGIFLDTGFYKTGNSDNKILVLNNNGRLKSYEMQESEEINPIYNSEKRNYYTESQVDNMLSNGRIAYNWGNHNLSGYISEEIDPGWQQSKLDYYNKVKIDEMLDKIDAVYNWGNRNDEGYITSELDPVWNSEKDDYYTIQEIYEDFAVGTASNNNYPYYDGKKLVGGIIKEQGDNINVSGNLSTTSGVLVKYNGENCNIDRHGAIIYDTGNIYICLKGGWSPMILSGS